MAMDMFCNLYGVLIVGQIRPQRRRLVHAIVPKLRARARHQRHAHDVQVRYGVALCGDYAIATTRELTCA